MHMKIAVRIGIVLLFVGSAVFLYKQQHEYILNKILVEKLKKEVSMGKPSREGGAASFDRLRMSQEGVRVNEVPHCSGAGASCVQGESVQMTGRAVAHRWSDLQPLVKDTVVQVFSQIAEFNWLEPYKTPNQGGGSGSGFFINDEGYLITNWHVVDQACAVSIQIPSLGKRRLDVDVIGVNPDRDLALLRLQPDDLKVVRDILGKVPYLDLGNSDDVARSDEIMTLGYPLGQQSLKSTTGVVSGREHIGGSYMIQISAPINPGNSGGPSINQCAQVVGVNSSGFRAADAQNVNYIIPSNEVKLFLKQIEQLPAEQLPTDGSGDTERKIKFLRKPFLGVFFNNGTDSLTNFLGNPQPGGLYVVQTYKGSPLEKAGVQSGDMIYEIDGHRIDSFGEMNVPWSEDKISIIDYISRVMLGDQVEVVVYRKGERLRLKFIFQISELAPIRMMFPGYEPIDYEIFGGMVVMPLALNHLPALVQVAPEIARYAEFKNQMDPALVIAHVLPDSVAFTARSIGQGAVLDEVNGVQVTTLGELRTALQKSRKTGFVTLRTKEKVFTVLPFDKMITDEGKLAKRFHYSITPLMRDLCEKQKTS